MPATQKLLLKLMQKWIKLLKNFIKKCNFSSTNINTCKEVELNADGK
jgi:hypothetical protein